MTFITSYSSWLNGCCITTTLAVPLMEEEARLNLPPEGPGTTWERDGASPCREHCTDETCRFSSTFRHTCSHCGGKYDFERDLYWDPRGATLGAGWHLHGCC